MIHARWRRANGARRKRSSGTRGAKAGDALDAVRVEMAPLASRFPPKPLRQAGSRIYEPFGPAVLPDERVWGAKDVLDTARIRALAPR